MFEFALSLAIGTYFLGNELEGLSIPARVTLKSVGVTFTIVTIMHGMKNNLFVNP